MYRELNHTQVPSLYIDWGLTTYLISEYESTQYTPPL